MNKLMKSIISIMAILTTVAYVTPVYAVNNREMVYSKLKVDGEQYKTVVSTKEGEEVTQEDSEKELPIETKISYALEGKEIKAEDLAGKSGKVTITIECENKSAKQVVINGRTQTMYTPFVVALGMIINNHNNKNIEVSNFAKAIENGEKTIVAGVVLPGLEESLALTGKLAKIDIPSSLEITMDTEEFEMSNIMIYATPKVLTEDINWTEFDDLFDSVNELQTAINTIEQGSSSLLEGTKQLKDGALALADGSKEVYSGSKELQGRVASSVAALKANNSNALDEDMLNAIGEQASDMIEEKLTDQTLKGRILQKLEGIITTFMSNSNVQAAIGQAAQGALNQAEVTTIVTNATQNGVVQASSMATALENNVVATVNDTNTNIEVSITDYKNSAEYAQLDDSAKALVDTLAANIKTDAETQANTKLSNAIDTAKTEAKESAVTSAKEQLQALERVAAGTAAQSAAMTTTSEMVGAATTAGVQQAFALLKTNLAAQADTIIASELPTIQTFASEAVKNVANQVANGVKEEAMKTVQGQMEQLLQEGITPLTEGLNQINTGATALTEGTKALEDGATELTDGIHQFNVEGIGQISNLVNIDLRNVVARGKALEKLANEYNTFQSEEKREHISFISMVDSIKEAKQEEEKK